MHVKALNIPLQAYSTSSAEQIAGLRSWVGGREPSVGSCTLSQLNQRLSAAERVAAVLQRPEGVSMQEVEDIVAVLHESRQQLHTVRHVEELNQCKHATTHTTYTTIRMQDDLAAP